MTIATPPYRFPLCLRRACGILLFVVHLCAGAAATTVAPAPLPQLPWLAQGDAQARLALRLLADASAHGLDPARYGAGALQHRLDTLQDADAAAFERELTGAMLQYLAEVHAGRIPSAYRPAGADRFDPLAHLARAVREHGLAQAVEAAAPAIPLYRRVKATLADYRELASVYPQWPALPPLPGARIGAGSRYDGAALLRERLQLLGDLDADADVAAGTDQVYSAQLAAAVARFQARHGLAPDGVLGAATFAALAVPPASRVAQLELTLERLRWLPPLPPGRVVAVNLPAYRLWAFDGAADPATPVLEMRVIVGTALRTPTPLFIGQMRYLEINPYWNVPRSIELGEIIPKLARNPAYLRDNDMELVAPSGAVVAETSADALAALRAGKLRVRQRPGPRNALGALKFALPNAMNIYLHSTPAQELFERTRRDLSHGCIRVEFPAELAQFVLADPQHWRSADVQAAIDGGRTRTLTLPAPVPVILFYATAVTDRDGRALFAEDIYRLDAPLIERLRASAGQAVPGP